MGPKNSAATCASAPSPRDLSWIDRMYMKFETMCVEVDKNPSLLLQETSKYVESQVNAVGANVKKLCTELIQDLISTPMLSPEGGEKKLECALHCKCHCMDSERPKLIGTDAAGVDNEDGTFNDIGYQKQDIMKKEGTKVETQNIMKKEVKKVEMLKMDVAREPQNPQSLEVCGPELSNIHGQVGIDTEHKLNTAVVGQFETEDVGGHKNLEEKLGLAKDIKKCTVQQGESEGTYKSCDIRENKTTSEGSVRGVMEAAMCRSEVVFPKQASRPKANDNKERFGANESIATHTNGTIDTFLGSQEDDQQPQVLEFLQEMQARNVEGHCKRPASNVDFQHAFTREIESYLNIDASYANCKYDSIFSAEDLQAEEVKDTARVGGSLQFMYAYDFKDDKTIAMSEFFSKEDVHDEEQSARWFVSEDLRKALQPEVFSVEKSQSGECFVNEFDLDWELL